VGAFEKFWSDAKMQKILQQGEKMRLLKNATLFLDRHRQPVIILAGA